MADKTVTGTGPHKVTAGDTNESVLTINSVFSRFFDLYIETDSVNSGTIQFSVGKATSGDNPALAAVQKVGPLGASQDVKLQWKQSNGADSYIVTVTPK